MRAGRAIGATLALLLISCGGFDNGPLRVGVVRGTVTGAQPEQALISVLGHPEVRAPVDAAGHFELRDVPAGSAELLVVASASLASRVPAQVKGGAVSDLGTLVPEPAAFVRLRLSTPGHQSTDGARAQAVGTPYEDLAPDSGGEVRVGPLGAGCYELEVSLPGLGQVHSASCVSSGAEAGVPVEFEPPDGSEGHEGCSVSGCEDHLRCGTDGSCSECVAPADCREGLTCLQGRCEGMVEACEHCDGDWQCQATGASCQSVGQQQICVFQCSATQPCTTQGFTCQAGQCLPDPTHATSCQGYEFVGEGCSSDTTCRNNGIPDGVCFQGSCTHPCASNAECPRDFACVSTASGPLCQSL